MGAVLRLMTWNLWWRFGPWEARYGPIEAVIAAEAPDVVCLQEVWSEGSVSAASRLAAALGYHHALTDSTRPGDFGFHNAVLSRWPIQSVDSVALTGADGAPSHRRILWTVVDSPWGPWPVVSTHFAYRFDESGVRDRQSLELLRLLADCRDAPEVSLPPLVGGDLNAVPDSDEVRRLTGRRAGVPGIVLTDVWEQVGDADGATWRRDNPYVADSAWPDRRLDYLLVAWPRPKPVGNPVRAWLAGREAIDGVVPSDHAAVVAELVVPAR